MQHPIRRKGGATNNPWIRLRSLQIACALFACCSLCGAFLPPPPLATARDQQRTFSVASSPTHYERRARSSTAAGAVRMQQQDNDELQVAVRTLAAQVEDLTAMVRQLAVDQPGGVVATATVVAGAEISPLLPATQNLNGAAVGNGAAVPVVKAAKGGGSGELVSTSAAQQRIDQWLRESGGGPVPAAPAAAVAPAAVTPIAEPDVVFAAVVAPVVAPEVAAPPVAAPPADAAPAGSGYKVKIEFEGAIHEVTCDADTTVLEAAMDAGLELPHSCMSGSCLTCPGKLVSGSVDQSEGVLEEDQTEAGYLLTCISYPQSDLHFAVIEEDDLP